MTALTPSRRRLRALGRLLYWTAAALTATVLLFALNWALYLIWPAYVVGGAALVGIYLYDRRARRDRRSH